MESCLHNVKAIIGSLLYPLANALVEECFEIITKSIEIINKHLMVGPTYIYICKLPINRRVAVIFRNINNPYVPELQSVPPNIAPEHSNKMRAASHEGFLRSLPTEATSIFSARPNRMREDPEPTLKSQVLRLRVHSLGSCVSFL